jgi:hypothetical protein
VPVVKKLLLGEPGLISWFSLLWWSPQVSLLEMLRPMAVPLLKEMALDRFCHTGIIRVENFVNFCNHITSSLGVMLFVVITVAWQVHRTLSLSCPEHIDQKL